MQTAMQKAFVASPSQKMGVKRSQTVRVCCAAQERKNVVTEGAKLLSAGLLSAAMLMGAPADVEAKVVLVQPEVKNFVKGTSPAPRASSGSSGKAAAKAKGPPPAAMTSEGSDPKGLILPLSLVVLAGGAAAWNAADPGLAEMMVQGGAKDSRAYAGYETVLKNTPFFGGNGQIPSSLPGNDAKKGASKKGKK